MNLHEQITHANSLTTQEYETINTMAEAQRLADCVVDAAIAWHKSGMEECLDQAQTLEDAIEELLRFRNRMPIVKSR